MFRLVSLASVILLAGCVATTTPNPPNFNLAGIGVVSISFYDIPEAPSRVDDVLYSTFAEQAPLRGIPFNPGIDGTVAVHGYLHVTGSGSGTLLIYDFEFDDQDGNRLFRTGGTTASPATPSDPWDIIDYRFAADLIGQVLDEFSTWLADNADNNVGV
jgi:hypothetical protein